MNYEYIAVRTAATLMGGCVITMLGSAAAVVVDAAYDEITAARYTELECRVMSAADELRRLRDKP